MRRTALVLVALAIFGLFSMPLFAGCPGRCELPALPGLNPTCVTYYVLITGCDMLNASTCLEETCVFYPPDPDCGPPYTTSIPPPNEVAAASRLTEIGSGDPGRADPQKSLCRADDDVDGPEIEVLETVQIPART